jgi:hypothetical protein
LSTFDILSLAVSDALTETSDSSISRVAIADAALRTVSL